MRRTKGWVHTQLPIYRIIIYSFNRWSCTKIKIENCHFYFKSNMIFFSLAKKCMTQIRFQAEHVKKIWIHSMSSFAMSKIFIQSKVMLEHDAKILIRKMFLVFRHLSWLSLSQSLIALVNGNTTQTAIHHFWCWYQHYTNSHFN
jgi:hypothetical protein